MDVTESLRCAEYLADSPCTSAGPATLGSSTSISTHHRRRSAKILEQNRTITASAFTAQRFVLGQLPVNRKRPAATERLNASQWPSVLSLPDKTVHQDNRCLESLFHAQNSTAVHGNYFLSVQTSVQPNHRRAAVEWLYDVCKEEECEPDVFPLAVSFVDRFLSVQQITREQLQTLASVCLFISSKVKAPQPLNANRIAYFTDGGVPPNDILSWEMLVLSKLNWDVSTSTALDFLDQVAARHSTLHSLCAACRIAVHRIQLEEKFAFLVPSVQAAICLLFCAAQSGSSAVLSCAEQALCTVLRCNPKILYGYMELVERVVDGSSRGAQTQDISPGTLVAPPSSGVYRSPAASPPPSLPPLSCLSSINSTFTTPEHYSRASDDSGFNSGFSSPAAAFDLKQQVQSGAQRESAAARRHARRSAPSRFPLSSRRSTDRSFVSAESVTSTLMGTFYASERDFLNYF